MVKRKKPNIHQQSLGDELENPKTYGVRVSPAPSTCSLQCWQMPEHTSSSALLNTCIHADEASAWQKAEGRSR